MLNYNPSVAASDVEYYKYHGYLILENLIDSALIDEVYNQTIQIEMSNRLDIWKRRPSGAILKLATLPSIIDILFKIYEYQPFPFQTLNFRQSPEIRVHSDTIHFNTTPSGYMCGVWVALEDSTADNGPLIYYPHSHNLKPTMFEDLNLTPDKEHHLTNLGLMSNYLDDKIKALKIESKTLTCKKGTLLIWDANLMHKSGKPRPNTTRCSQVTHYYFKAPNIEYLQPAYGKYFKKKDAFSLQNHIESL